MIYLVDEIICLEASLYQFSHTIPIHRGIGLLYFKRRDDAQSVSNMHDSSCKLALETPKTKHKAEPMIVIRTDCFSSLRDVLIPFKALVYCRSAKFCGFEVLYCYV